METGIFLDSLEQRGGNCDLRGFQRIEGHESILCAYAIRFEPSRFEPAKFAAYGVGQNFIGGKAEVETNSPASSETHGHGVEETIDPVMLVSGSFQGTHFRASSLGIE
jgi:hypothetical protein